MPRQHSTSPSWISSASTTASRSASGAAQERLPAYYATGIGQPEEIARLSQEKVAEGYSRIQIKVGGRDVAIDIAVVRKV